MQHRDGEHGPSASDVAEYARALMDQMRLFIRFDVTVPLKANTPYALWVRCVAWREGSQGIRVDVYAEGHQWPTKECKTLTALMYRLLHELDAQHGWEAFMNATR